MPELHLKQPRFTKSACGSFSKHRDHLLKIQKFRERYLLILLSAYSDSKNEAKELFQIRSSKKELMKLLEIIIMMEIKEH